MGIAESVFYSVVAIMVSVIIIVLIEKVGKK